MLSADDFHLPDDVEAMRAENELLALENQLLRASLTTAMPRDEALKAIARERREEREIGRAEVHRIRAKYEADKAERRERFASVAHGRVRELNKAESDLRWLVGRLNRSPVGWLLRRRNSWRELVRRSGA